MIDGAPRSDAVDRLSSTNYVKYFLNLVSWISQDPVPLNKKNTSTTVPLMKIKLASYDVKEISFAN